MACLAVLVYHVWTVGGSAPLILAGVDLSGATELGGFGLDLFFVLSGFLLIQAWLRGPAAEGPSLRRYALRRFFRIVPLYYLSILVLALLRASAHPGFPQPPVTPAVIVAHLAFAPFLARSPALNGVYWSLSTEMQFYVLLPLIAPFFLGRRWWLAGVGCVSVALLWRLFALAALADAPLPPQTTGVRTYINMVFVLGRLDSFGLGMASAAYLATGPRPAVGRRLLGLGLAVITALPLVLRLGVQGHDPGPFVYFLGPLLRAAGAAMLLLGCILWRGGPASIWRHPLLRGAGLLSYSMYIWHLPVLSDVVGITQGAVPVELALAAGVLTSMAVSLVTYWLVERPGIRLGETVINRVCPPASVPPHPRLSRLSGPVVANSGRT